MSVTLFNTMSRSVEQLKPLNPPLVKIYCCGPTVYDFQHIGNFRTFLFEDLLVRTLRFAGYDVQHVMNITDVGHLVGDADAGEDKMLVATRREKKKSQEIAEYYTAKFFEDWDRLHLLRPQVVCKATEHISDMVDLIGRIEKNGKTYVSGGNVYFDVAKCSDYGKLAQLDLARQMAGTRVDIDPNKHNPFDFVLWFTKSKFENQELQWESPWGRGYPGWHIECSAMSMRYLGEQFDIHCGGVDHVPVHHTNEIAQSEAATGKPWVGLWMHGEFLLLNNLKMSKSAGTFTVLDDLISRGFEPLAYRYFCLSGHYRQQISLSWEAIEGANNAFLRLKEQVLALKDEAASGLVSTEGGTILRRFTEAITKDLNAPQALAVMWELLGAKAITPAEKLAVLERMDLVLGFGVAAMTRAEVPAEVQALIQEREAARKAKNWPRSDELRDAIERLGFILKDSPKGAVVTKR
ncbi:MAG: cysteine--tRNA ligase [Proteobacteria bacterium]|nr:cysteine--tRNA ligase [Pseudomonadota bacterium]